MSHDWNSACSGNLNVAKSSLITQIILYYLLLLLVHWVMDYLEIWFGVCARKIVNYHLGTEYQMTNISTGKWQKKAKDAYSEKKRDDNIA